MIRIGVCIALLLLWSWPVAALAQVARTVDWSDGKVIVIKGALGITTQVALDPQEAVLDYSLGFTEGWDVVRRDQVFYLKPKTQDAATNLLIRTDRRQYLIELVVLQGTWRQLDELPKAGVAYRVDIRIPPSVAATADIEGSKPATAAVPTPAPKAPEPKYRSCDYAIRHVRLLPAAQQPDWICDDGERTVVQYRADARLQLPIVLGVDSSGRSYRINYRAEGSRLIVDGLHPGLQLRNGWRLSEVRYGAF